MASPIVESQQPGDLGVLREATVASRRKRGPVALRLELSPGLPLSSFTFGQIGEIQCVELRMRLCPLRVLTV
jgi:hypothetical protein